MTDSNQTPYMAIGGHEALKKLIDVFYDKVSKHPELASIFPDDLTETARKQTQFLTQFLGGPPIYSEEHGHPMLRARHMPFVITPQHASAWLNCMNEAMTEVDIPSPWREQIFSRLTFTAHHMVNHTHERD
jgi:hemoglobin